MVLGIGTVLIMENGMVPCSSGGTPNLHYPDLQPASVLPGALVTSNNFERYYVCTP
jgi:hypothetical protein